ncbi:sensor histidine kinase [Glycomyces tritici]|uniref:Sensor-like histidine kinase SenX3 n=1 Tax=Glycomyces tritici TaxID=2665176 RepID=A0ABT7YPJ9_9ACTN|nr:ATP-binding protein [Glycomyces tritici]MDN3240568.1 ATP-binding protein [Glycomyces tritici]
MAHNDSSQPLASLRRSAGRVLTGLAAGAAFGAAASALMRTRQRGAPRPEVRTAPVADSRPWEAATDLLRTGVCLVDDHNRVLYTNRAARDLGLVDDHEIVSLTLRALLAQARRSGRYRDAEIEVPKQVMGEPSAVSVRITPLPDGVSVAEFQDISELHRVERVRRDFVANISHELKTPVGAMQILAEALKDAAEDPDASARFAARIQSESKRMNHLVSDLLELSRLQGAEKLPDPEPVEVDRIIAEAFDQTRIAAEEKGIELSYSGVRGAEVLGSESQLVTAVKNLVGNAISYSPENTTVEVASSIASPTGHLAGVKMVCIAVRDQGIGIPAEELDRIFERFYRVDAARSRSTGGTGLGLAIVKHVAVNHGGRVEVSSMPEAGSVFTLMLPARSLPSDATAPESDAIGTSQQAGL